MVLAIMALAPSASPQVPEVPVPEHVPAVCGTKTGAFYALKHITAETPGHVPGTHMGCAGFPL